MNSLENNIVKINEYLEKDGKYVGVTVGNSMRPMIRSGRDVVVIEKKNARLKVFDVALYVKEKSYVLHRVLKVTENGYVMRGDNCYFDENIREEDVIGRLIGFFKGKKYISVDCKKYLRYIKRRLLFYKVRKVFYIIKRKITTKRKDEKGH
jgi:signal peptidase I